MPHTSEHTPLSPTRNRHRHHYVARSHRLDHTVVSEMHIYRRYSLVILYVHFRLRHVMRCSQVNEPHTVRLGSTCITTSRKQKIARVIFHLRDICRMWPLPLRILAESHWVRCSRLGCLERQSVLCDSVEISYP